MFSEYFVEQSKHLLHSLEKGTGSVKKEKTKDLKQFNEFYRFLKDHIPADLTLAKGKVRNKKHLLNKSCDVLIYEKFVPKILEMGGGYVLADLILAFMTIDEEINARSIDTHLNLTSALKTLYRMDRVIADNIIIPMYSMHFVYNTGIGLEKYRERIYDFSEAKGIPVNSQPDLICVINDGLMMKNWENRGQYVILETGEDTLLWFFILMMEYIDRNNSMPLDLRGLLKVNKRYNEY